MGPKTPPQQLGFTFDAPPVTLEDVVGGGSDAEVLDGSDESSSVAALDENPIVNILETPVEVERPYAYQAGVSRTTGKPVEPFPWETRSQPGSPIIPEKPFPPGTFDYSHLENCPSFERAYLESIDWDQPLPSHVEVFQYLETGPEPEDREMISEEDSSNGSGIDLEDLLPQGSYLPSEQESWDNFWEVLDAMSQSGDYGQFENDSGVETFYSDDQLNTRDFSEILAEVEVIPFSLDNFTYHCDAEFEPGQFGKCVMYVSPDDEVHLAIGKTHPLLLARVNTPAEDARNFFQRGLQGLVDLHRYTYHNIPSENVHRNLGGGAYLARGGNTVVVDFESGDFGKMHATLVARCLDSRGLKLEMVDDKYFASGTAEEYLERKLG
jgi:hypothetical protein